jgi:putative nucleotidyltransferase with HDIG domain
MHPALQRVLEDPARAADAYSALAAALRADLPLLDDLASTPQDSSWHAEGDVATHTAWVMREAMALADAYDLPAHRRLTLLLAALLHDIAKPLTTREQEIDGRIRVVAPHHAELGRSWLAPRLLPLGLPYPMLCDVLALVGAHHAPKKLVLRSKPLAAYRGLATRADLSLLYLLARADMQGRACDDKPTQLDIIDMFRLDAEAHGLLPEGADALRAPAPRWWLDWALALAPHLGDPLHDPTDTEALEYTLGHGRRDAVEGVISTHHEALARSFTRRKQGIASVWLTCGPSGSGKSRWVTEHLPDHDVICLDDLRQELSGDAEDQSLNGQVLQLGRERLRQSLRARRAVVWDATSLRASFRAAVLGLANEYGLHTTLAVFHLTPDATATRNRQRARQVPVNVLERQLRAFEWPQTDEADRTLFIDQRGQTLYDTRDDILAALRAQSRP